MTAPNPPSAKRVARVKLTLTKRAVEAMTPGDKPWIAWDDKLTGFGVQVHPTGAKSFLVNYRTDGGGRKAPNKRVVLGRFGRLTVDEARNMAKQALGKAAGGDDPATKRAAARAMPLLEDAFEDYMKVNPKRSESSNRMYRAEFGYCLGDWRTRPLDSIERRDVEERFIRLTRDHGWAGANRSIALLRSVYRRPCVDIEGLRNPVDLWLAGGGEYHRPRRRKISNPAEVLPRWRAGIEAVVVMPASRDAFFFGLYTGMRIQEVLPLRWERIDMEGLSFRVEETKTGEPLELPVTRQLAAILERRRVGNEAMPDALRAWVFPSTLSGSGHLANLGHLYARIGAAAGTKFWYHGLRNAFITVAERDLLLPRALTKRLVNHARPGDVTEGYAADWTIGQLRDPAQRIADRIEALMNGAAADGAATPAATAAPVTAGAMAHTEAAS